MGFRSLADSGADRTTLQTYLAQGTMQTTTIRISENLKEALSSEALLSGMSVSAYIRQLAIAHLLDEAGETR